MLWNIDKINIKPIIKELQISKQGFTELRKEKRYIINPFMLFIKDGLYSSDFIKSYGKIVKLMSNNDGRKHLKMLKFTNSLAIIYEEH